MKKYYAFIAFALLSALYIYMVYRAEQTVVNMVLFKILFLLSQYCIWRILGLDRNAFGFEKNAPYPLG